MGKRLNIETTPIDDLFGEMMTWAVRYALGRRTYAVSDTCGYISPIISKLDDRTICCMQRDIREQKDYGDPCDKDAWLRLKNKLDAEIYSRGLREWS